MSSLDREALINDSRADRVYEKEIEKMCRDEYCAIDEETGKPMVLSVAEKERTFIDAMQAYFFDGRQVLKDKDFDQLKEDLLWEGSSVAALSRDENKYLAVMQAYLSGSPIMTDQEFDALKRKLREDGSIVAVSKEPKCFVDTGVCSVTWTQDRVRQYVTYLPTVAVVSALWLVLAFEATPLRFINPVVTIILGAPLIYFGSLFAAENVFFKRPFIVSGPCPVCNADNRVFFGDVLGVQGFSDAASIKCGNCKADLSVSRGTRRVTASKGSTATGEVLQAAA